MGDVNICTNSEDSIDKNLGPIIFVEINITSYTSVFSAVIQKGQLTEH